MAAISAMERTGRAYRPKPLLDRLVDSWDVIKRNLIVVRSTHSMACSANS